MSGSQISPDLAQAKAFLDALGGTMTFQTLPEAAEEEGNLNRSLHGSLAEHGKRLARINGRGGGAFVMVNEGNGQKRKTENVTRVRAVFVDLDGAPLQPVLDAEVPPSMVVESSPDRFHAYWLVRDMPLHDFNGAQKALAVRFSGDMAVCDLPRLMRIPGFTHHKRDPVQSKLLSCEPELVWDWPVLAEAMALPRSMTLPTVIPEGQRNLTLFKLARASHRQGIPQDERLKSLLRVNSERCSPPLSEDDVRSLVDRAYREVLDGFLKIPMRVLGLPEFLALGSGEKLLLLLAYLHINGKASAESPLVWTQFKQHFKRENTFEGYRKRLVASGLLQKVRNGKPPTQGRRPEPAIFRLVHTGANSAHVVPT